MKTLTCKDLGGTCETEFFGESFEEIGQKSHAHVIEQIKNGDVAHKNAVEKMKNATSEERERMMVEFQKRYDEVSES